MPIEIKELHIKINVSDENVRNRPVQDNPLEKEKLIEACVEQVMEILAKKEER